MIEYRVNSMIVYWNKLAEPRAKMIANSEWRRLPKDHPLMRRSLRALQRSLYEGQIEFRITADKK